MEPRHALGNVWYWRWRRRCRLTGGDLLIVRSERSSQHTTTRSGVPGALARHSGPGLVPSPRRAPEEVCGPRLFWAMRCKYDETRIRPVNPVSPSSVGVHRRRTLNAENDIVSIQPTDPFATLAGARYPLRRTGGRPHGRPSAEHRKLRTRLRT